MAFYRKAKLNKGTKENPQYIWFPRAILVGKQITVKELSKRIAAESTPSPFRGRQEGGHTSHYNSSL